MEFLVLGPLEIVDSGRRLPLGRGRPRTLLLALLCNLNATVSADVLVEDVWGADPPQHPSGALQVQVSILRKTLGLPADPTVRPALATDGPGYVLRADPSAIDAVRFESAVEQAGDLLAAGDCPADIVLDRLDAASAMWRGAPLIDVAYTEFAQGWIRRLDELRLVSTETRSAALLALGRDDEAATELAQAVAEHPLRERRHALLMLALYRQGRQAEALRAFDRARALLLEELGIDPGDELSQMQASVLAHDVSLTSPNRAERTSQPRPSPAFAPLPLVVGSLIGRDDELAKLERLVHDERLVTISGPAGVGKTRLARELAGRFVAQGDEVWFVPLDGVSPGSGEELASTISVVRRPGVELHEALTHGLANVLQDRRVLVVLDTCEHVIDQLGPMLVQVQERCTQARVVATSRSPLRVRGEVVLRLEPLESRSSTPGRRAPAIELFCERAAAADARFELAPGDADVVADICRRVDGLPLAIELAAAQVDVFDVRLVRDRLALGHELTDDRQQNHPRHSSLRAALAWSIELLDDEQRRYFTQLGAFTGGFTRPAADAVAQTGAHGHEHLGALVRASLVQPLGGDRYRLLDAVAREAARLLHDGEVGGADATQARHARWYAAWLVEADAGTRGDERTRWMAALRAEEGNVRSALAWCFGAGEPRLGAKIAASMSWYWVLVGSYADADRWLSIAMERHRPPDRVRAAVLAGAVIHASSLGDNERTERLGLEALDTASVTQDSRLHAIVLGRLGIASWATGDHRRAARYQDEALRLYRAAGDGWNEAVATFLRARTAFEASEPDAAAMMGEALRLARATGDPYPVAIVLDNLARIALVEGRIARADVLAAQAAELARAHALQEVAISTSNTLGLIDLARGDHEAAAAHHRRALRDSLRTSFLAATCEALEGLALAADATGNDELVARLLAGAQVRRDQCLLKRTVLIDNLVTRTAETVGARLGPGGWQDATTDGRSWSDAELSALASDAVERR